MSRRRRWRALLLLPLLLAAHPSRALADGEDDGDEVGDDYSRPEKAREFDSAFYLEGDFGRRVVSLTPQPSAGPARLEPGGTRAGFTVTDSVSLTGSFDVGVTYWNSRTEGRYANLRLGLMPSVGARAQLIRFAASPAQLRRMPLFAAPPASASDLRTWATGDAAFFEASAGLLVSVGTDFGPVGISGNVAVKGEYRVGITKADASHAIVTLRRTKLFSISLETSAGFASLSLEAYRQLAASYAYAVDLADPAGRAAFRSLMAGDLASVQARVNAEGPGVISWEKIRNLETGRTAGAYLTFPFLGKSSWESGFSHETDHTDWLADGGFADSHYGYFSREKDRSLLGKHRRVEENFYGAAVRSFDGRGRLTERDVFAEYLWVYSDDVASTDSLQRAVRALGERSVPGLPLTLAAAGPIAPGYADVKVRVHFTRGQTLRIIRAASSLGRSYFAARGLTKLHDSLAGMGDPFRRGDDRAFTEAYSRAGREAMRSADAFATLLSLAGPGVLLETVVEGERFPRYAAAFRTTRRPGELTRAPFPAAVSDAPGRGVPTVAELDSYFR